MMQEEDERKADPRKPTVLFCNPNGVFIQFFGYDNQTIRNYLRQVHLPSPRATTSFCGTTEATLSPPAAHLS